ncbi:dodecin [Methylophaga sp.]|uniref:dodecin n=1 Tax=Methylophaga sp. TaxID=2024840 RepID=UPI00271AF721|nr:dodecin [Methylophaga sp.]MDO8826343.1 dodecin family protein [Methylophaga sp.]
MTEHVYKHIEITGSSVESSDKAIENAIAKASETVKNLHWFEVTDTRGYIENGGVRYWQVTIKLGFRIED